MKRVLCIGNSFSEDATRYLQKLAGGELWVRNCYIAGCSLQRHYENSRTAAPEYQYQEDAAALCMISLREALLAEPWDVVTLQQASGLSGKPESFTPYLPQLCGYVRTLAPQAALWWHETWAYEAGAAHPDFPNYGCDRLAMADAILRTARNVCADYGLRMIPSGELIRRLHEQPAWDPARGGLSLHRDGYHLSFDYGRYAAALLWNAMLTGQNPEAASYAPDLTEESLIVRLRRAARETAEAELNRSL